jgi:Uma2 family endonuclease
VEKGMGFEESSLAGWLTYLLYDGIGDRDLGKLSGESGMMRLGTGLVRAPGLSFTRWSKFPDGERSAAPIADLVPDLAIEVLSASNTPGEMRRKLGEYFRAGAELVWIVDLVRRVVVVHTAPQTSTTLTEADTLDGAGVLPGFRIPVSRVFEKTPVAKPKARRRKGP